MEGKRIYIFFTYQFNQIGGSQMYTVGKAKYLEEAEHLRHVPKVRDTYKKRKETIDLFGNINICYNPIGDRNENDRASG